MTTGTDRQGMTNKDLPAEEARWLLKEIDEQKAEIGRLRESLTKAEGLLKEVSAADLDFEAVAAEWLRADIDLFVEGNASEPGAHASDCATNNAPALPTGPCDCGAEKSGGGQ